MNIGDRVRTRRGVVVGNGNVEDVTGTIIHVGASILVRFDQEIDGHGVSHKDWWVIEEEVEVIDHVTEPLFGKLL